MKKLKAMMTFVLVALMAFTVQSCSDDDNNDLKYKMTTSLKITNPGDLTTAECEAMIMAAKSEVIGEYSSDQAAIDATERSAQLMAEDLYLKKSQLKNTVMSFSFITTKMKTGAQIVTYYVDYNKGDINYYSNKN